MLWQAAGVGPPWAKPRTCAMLAADMVGGSRFAGAENRPSFRVDAGAAAHPAGEHERMGEDALQIGLAPDLAHDVASDPATVQAAGSDLTSSIGRTDLSLRSASLSTCRPSATARSATAATPT
jgi:hypothetical protein